MTSTADRTDHPDVAEISDLTEGLLPPDRITAVRRHLDECELCSEVHASLEEVRGLLGELPAPPHMPDDVVRRIDAALASEALLGTTGREPGMPEETVGDETASPDDHRAPVSRETSATTAPGRPAGTARPSTTGPGRGSRRPGTARRGRRRMAMLGTAFTVAALGLSSLFLASLDDTGNTDGDDRRVTAADTFAAGELEQQVTELLGRAAPAETGARTPNTFGLESEASGTSPRTLKQPAVPECVRDGISSDDDALATETGVFQGKKALLVVLPDAADERRVTAYVMEATCVDRPSAGTAQVLLKESYARP
ncbi:anti-sigma factor family protein [Streptomyces sp. enrichment culture]|uniref:anti-sigma factor family protein n=1 Tax=Streptomyces sp. enrichment culture TaxID=1795815 RepID=UPI003F54EAD0